MKLTTKLVCLISIFSMSYAQSVYADNLMNTYQAFIENFPSVQSYYYKNQALNLDSQGLIRGRFINPTATTLYSNYQTANEGVFSITDFSFANTIDVFNKIGIDKQKNKNEIQKNILLTKNEKKNLFSKVLDSYFNLIKNKYLLQVHQENLKWINNNISYVSKGVEGGIFPKTEITRWNIARFNQLNTIENDKLEILKSENTLKLYSQLEKIITDDLDFNGTFITQHPIVAEDDYIKNDSELANLYIDQKQLALDIKKEKITSLPDLQLSDTFEINGDPTANGNQNIALAALNFKLPDGGKKNRILSAKQKINGIEFDKKNRILLLREDFRSRIIEIESEKKVLNNWKNALDLSQDNLKKLLTGYQKRFIDYTTLVNAAKDQQSIQENYITTLALLNQNYQHLYHLTKGDIY